MKTGLATLSLLMLGGIAGAQRLPNIAVPSHYKLSLDPVIQVQRFSGDEVIDVQVKQATREVVLNCLDLEITVAEIAASGETQTAQVSYDKESEMVRLKVDKEIEPGGAAIHLKYSGKLTDGLRGLYLSKTSRRSYAVTQSEGTYARMMFPGFDEPGYKATFDITVMADEGDTAISNGRIIRDVPIAGSNRHAISFSTSPKMSTYLVALAIGDWKCLERTVDKIPIRVCAVPEDKDKGQFALDVATHSIQFYDHWYGIAYPFGKLDMLAIPDYEWGGMENTASIFYRDTALLLDTSTASVFDTRWHSTVIAHEIAHQWFGDLVTPSWWDDIWLNESFATWMESKPIEAWHPEWHLEDQDAAQSQQIIGVDSLGSTRAIHGDPKTSAEIKEMFDGITYEKGAAVLSMLESFVGAEAFRKGVNAYLQANANGNATAADFWQAEAQSSGKPIDKVMPTFVLQPGIPVLSMTNSCTGGHGSVELTQRRFFLSAARLNAGSPEQWQIPVCIKSSGGDACAVIVNKTQKIPLAHCAAWVMPNRDAKGYYRVAYSPEDLNSVARVAETALNPPERIALVEDTWAMTRVGNTSAGDFLGLAGQLRSERNLTVINLLAGHLDYIGTLVPEDRKEQYHAFIRRQFGEPAKDAGWTVHHDDSDERKALRASLLGILGNADDAEAIATANKVVQSYMREPASVDGTLVGEAFAIAAAHGDASLYDEFQAALSNAKSTGEYNHYLYSLAEFKQAALVNRTLDLIEQGKVRQQEYPGLFSDLLSNPTAREAAWAYLKSHWDDLSEKVTSFGGGGAISALASSCSPQFRADVDQFFKQHRAPGAERTVAESLERMDNCIEFKKVQQKNLDSWLLSSSQK